MLSEGITPVATIAVNSTFNPTPDSYPHYRLIPAPTAAGKMFCLLFYIKPNAYLMLEPKVQRYQAIRRLRRLLETAPFAVFEVKY